MFKRAFVCSIALIAVASFALYWSHIRVDPQDVSAYAALVEETTQLRTKRTFEEEPVIQTRKQVQKDVWTKESVAKDQKERHFQIKADHSELTLNQKKDKVEAIEKLTGLTLQSDFILTADEGTFSFPFNEFVAQGHCHLMKDQDFIDGDQIQCNITQETITYQNPRGHFVNGLTFSANELIWKKKENKLYLKDQVIIQEPDQSILIANSGTLILNEFEPKLLTLQGNVQILSTRINNKESHAIADTLTYDPQQKTLLLNADKNVLFWQEGLTLSAPEVLIKQKQEIEGHGTVHFSFDMEEQNYIDQFFKQYL